MVKRTTVCGARKWKILRAAEGKGDSKRHGIPLGILAESGKNPESGSRPPKMELKLPYHPTILASSHSVGVDYAAIPPISTEKRALSARMPLDDAI
jgi:hypothetical protein